MELTMRTCEKELLNAIKEQSATLVELLLRVDSHWQYEDGIYRFYHQSFKVYGIQRTTCRIVTTLKDLAPDLHLNPMFLEIVRRGTGKTFENSHNQDWLGHTAPMLEAFFHARFFLQMAVKYGVELEEVPQILPSGWAALLELYRLR